MPRTLSLLACLLLLLAGCERDEIQTYTVPKPTAPPESRLLAAILDNADEQWYVKLLGRDDLVGSQAKQFNAFVGSIRFPAKDDKKAKPVSWTVPEGWTEAAPAAKPGLRYATFKTSDAPRAPEATVFRFPKSGLLENVNRWRRLDLGLPPLKEDQLEGIVQKVKAGEREAWLVDMRGPGPRKGDPHAGMPGMEGKGRPRPPRTLEIAYKAPPGWTETGPRGGFVPIHTAFAIEGDGQKAETTVIKQRALGDLQANVDRWRSQVGLPPAKAAPAAFAVGGVPGQYFDFDGGKTRILIVAAEKPGEVWTFKLTGPSALVAKNKEAFEAFVKSVTFTGAKR